MMDPYCALMAYNESNTVQAMYDMVTKHISFKPYVWKKGSFCQDGQTTNG